MEDRALLGRAFAGLAQLAGVMALCLFVPPWTLHYWQAWVFLAVFFGCSLAVTLYLYRHDRPLLERRSKGGPAAEQEASQKVIQAFASLAFLAALVVPALDRRFAWSLLPPAAALVGELLVALGFWIVYRVFQENSFPASTIEVDAEQRVVSTGPYALVRHPMYVGGLLLFLGIPLALGSGVGMLVFIPATIAIVARLLDEERFLLERLPGYEAYCRQTRYRLVPYLW